MDDMEELDKTTQEKDSISRQAVQRSQEAETLDNVDQHEDLHSPSNPGSQDSAGLGDVSLDALKPPSNNASPSSTNASKIALNEGTNTTALVNNDVKKVSSHVERKFTRVPLRISLHSQDVRRVSLTLALPGGLQPKDGPSDLTAQLLKTLEDKIGKEERYLAASRQLIMSTLALYRASPGPSEAISVGTDDIKRRLSAKSARSEASGVPIMPENVAEKMQTLGSGQLAVLESTVYHYTASIKKLEFLKNERAHLLDAPLEAGTEQATLGEGGIQLAHFLATEPLSKEKIYYKLPIIMERLAFEENRLAVLDRRQTNQEEHASAGSSFQASISTLTKAPFGRRYRRRPSLFKANATNGEASFSEHDFVKAKIRILKQARQSYEGLTFQPVAVHLQDESLDENKHPKDDRKSKLVTQKHSELVHNCRIKDESPDGGVVTARKFDLTNGAKLEVSKEKLDSATGESASEKKSAVRGIRASRVASMLPLMPELPGKDDTVDNSHGTGGGTLKIAVQLLRGGIVGNLPPHLFHNHRNSAKIDLDVLFELDKGTIGADGEGEDGGHGFHSKHRSIATNVLPKLVRRAEGHPERKASKAESSGTTGLERRTSKTESSRVSDSERESCKLRDTEKYVESSRKEGGSLGEEEDDEMDSVGAGLGHLILGSTSGEQSDVQARVLSQLLALNQEMLVVFSGREVLRLPIPNRAATRLEVTVRDRVKNLPLALLYLDVDALLEALEDGTEKALALDLEPSGVLALSLSFEPAVITKTAPESVSFMSPGFLVRKRALRQAVTPLFGHLFVKNRAAFLPVKCALCRLFIWRNTCQACLNCNLRVHRACIKDLYFICPKEDEGQAEAPENLQLDRHLPINAIESQGANSSQFLRKGGISFDVPHQWKPIDSLLPSFCAYCGLMGCTLYCAACFQVAVHASSCVSLLPRHCGIPKDMAVLLRLALEEEADQKEDSDSSQIVPLLDSESKDHGSSTKSSAFKGADVKIETKSSREKSPAASLPILACKAPSTRAGRMKEYISALPTIQALMAKGKSLRRTGVAADKDDGLVSLATLSFVAVLGRGNFGKVFLVQDSDGQFWALKALRKAYILENDDLDALFSELAVFSLGSSCPFLLHCEAAFQSPSAVFFLMPFIAGGDLMFHIQQRSFTPVRARFYAAQVVLALQYLHSHGVLYRDLKLDNILLGADGYLRIADYGLCKRLAVSSCQSSTQQFSSIGQLAGLKTDLKRSSSLAACTRTFCGTPEFMAPEILCSYPYTYPVDFWAFGVLLYELMYGRAPFYGSDENQIFAAILQATPSFRGAGVPIEATLLIKRLLVKDPAKRLQSWDDVREAKLFAGLDWDALASKTLPPPFVPDIGPYLRQPRNFDSEYLTEAVTTDDFFLSSLSPADQKRFRDFHYRRH